MANTEARPGKRRIVMLVLLVLVLVSTTLVANLLAKYSTQNGSYEKSRVASFNVTGLGMSQMELVTTNLCPGYTYQIPLNIKNDSEVAVSYTINLTSTGNLPLVFMVTDKDGNEVATLTPPSGDDLPVQSGNMKEFEFTGHLAPGGDSREYTLDMVWDEKDNSLDYIRMVDHIKITAEVVQLD